MHFRGVTMPKQQLPEQLWFVLLHFSVSIFVSSWVFVSVFKCLACSLVVCWWKHTARVYGFVNTSLWGWWTGSARLELNSIYLESRCLTNGHIRHRVNAGQLLVSVFYKNIWMNELREQNISCFYIQWAEITRKSTMMKHYCCALLIISRLILFVLNDRRICKTEEQVQGTERIK